MGGLLAEEEDEAEDDRRERGRVLSTDFEAVRSFSIERTEGSVRALSDFARTADLRCKVGERRPGFASAIDGSE